MKPGFPGTLLAAALAAAPQAHAAPLRADHPLIGAWRIVLGGCAEVYRIDRSGSMLVTSAAQVSETRLELSDQPSAQGFYKWVDTVVKDNGGKDCGGHVTPVGTTATNYIFMGPHGDDFLMCAEESRQTCFGPFVRVEGGGT